MATLRRIFTLCGDLAGSALIFLMSMTVTDVVGRHLGLTSVRGIIEMSTMAVVLIGFLALARSFIVGGHIIVDIATARLPRRVADRLDAVAMAAAALCLACVAVLMWRETIENYRSNAVSLDLQMPMVAFWVPAAIGMSLAPIACTVTAYRKWAGSGDGRHDGAG